MIILIDRTRKTVNLRVGMDIELLMGNFSLYQKELYSWIHKKIKPV